MVISLFLRLIDFNASLISFVMVKLNESYVKSILYFVTIFLGNKRSKGGLFYPTKKLNMLQTDFFTGTAILVRIPVY